MFNFLGGSVREALHRRDGDKWNRGWTGVEWDKIPVTTCNKSVYMHHLSFVQYSTNINSTLMWESNC